MTDGAGILKIVSDERLRRRLADMPDAELGSVIISRRDADKIEGTLDQCRLHPMSNDLAGQGIVCHRLFADAPMGNRRLMGFKVEIVKGDASVRFI